jgi:hypothetical protein
MRALKLYAVLAVLLVLSIAMASAQTATWTFSNANPGDATPFMLAADVGGPLTANFLNADYNVNAAGNDFANSGGGAPAFAGNFMIDTAPNSLSIDFGIPITAISFDFALVGDTDNLLVTTGAGDSISMPGAAYTPNDASLDPLYGGLFSWILPNPSSMVNLHGILAQGGLADLAFDNLSVNYRTPGVIPEPGAWAFLLAGVVPLALRLRRRA